MTGDPSPCRLDKWLWHARFVRTRALAHAVCTSGRLRVNGCLIAKPHHLVRPGDVLTLPLPSRIRIIRVIGTAQRRGPAREARLLYEDLEGEEVASVGGVESAPRGMVGNPRSSDPEVT